MPRRNADHPDHGKDAISLNEAACRLGVHPRTYIAMLDDGLVPGVKRQKTVVIPRDAYELFKRLGRMPRYEELEAA